MPLNTELMKYGLSQKEADVYLAMLEMGSATVQQIAQKSGVNRATTYIVLKRLMELGVVSTFDKGKKSFFSAENPKNLENVLAEQEKSIHARRQELEEFIPNLMGIFNLAKNKPVVKYFEGENATQNIRKEFLGNKGKVMRVMMPFYVYEWLTEDLIVENKKLLKQQKEGGMELRVICSISKEKKEKLTPEAKEYFNQFEHCFVDEKDFPINVDLGILGSTLSVVKLPKEKEQRKGFIDTGLVITDEVFVNQFIMMFDLAWKFCKIK